MLRYVQYRVSMEIECQRQFNPTVMRAERAWRWWTVQLPEYLWPPSLPNPPGTPPCPPPSILPAALLHRNAALYWRQFDNLLLFGHTRPTLPEVKFRRSYLDWYGSRTSTQALGGILVTCAMSATCDTCMRKGRVIL